MKLQWWPFIEISFVIANNKSNNENIINNLKLLQEYWIFLDIENNNFSLNKYFEWVILRDKKFFDLYLNIISEDLILFDFTFIYNTWINWEAYWVNEYYIKNNLVNFLKVLKNIFNFNIWIISKEDNIISFFKTKECYPHKDYNLSNINYEKLDNSELYFILS